MYILHCINRYNLYKNENLDRVMSYIENGKIKCGRYSKLVKVDKNSKLKGKVFFDED